MVAGGGGEGGIRRQNTEGFYGSEVTLCEMVIVESWRYAFSKTHRMYHIEGNPMYTLDSG